MIVGLGIDICENYRIAELYHKFGNRFLKRIYMPNEIEYCLSKKDPIPNLTARFAVKEAFIKALGLTRDLSLSYKEVSLKGGVGKKDIHISGTLAKLMASKEATRVTFSISHSKDYSTACVILEKE